MKKPYADTLGFIGGKMGPPEFTSEIFNRLRSTGVRLVQYSGPHPMPKNGWEDLITEVRDHEYLFERHGHVFRLVRGADDLDAIESINLVHVIMTVQNPYWIGENWGRVIDLWLAGIRVMQLTYWDERTDLYGSAFYSESDRGLTDVGKTYLRKLADSDFILDLSHCGPRTGLEAVETYKGPVMISHTGSRTVYDYPRNATDEVIGIVGREKNGLIGVYTMTFFLDKKDNGVRSWLDHIEHILALVGEDNVAVGSDAPVTGFTDIEAAKEDFFNTLLPALTRGRNIKPEWAPRWPAFIPAFSDTGRFQIMENLLVEWFGAEVARKIMWENALKFYRRALP